MWKIGVGVLTLALLFGCAGMAHVDLPPRVVWPPTGGDASQKPPESDPTRPLNLPDSRF